jgi:hypothetical protein
MLTYIELLYTVKIKLLAFRDADRYTLESRWDFQYLDGYRWGHNDKLGPLWEAVEYIADCLLKSMRAQVVGLLEAKNLNLLGVESVSGDHMLQSSWSSNNKMDTLLQNSHVITYGSTAGCSMTLQVFHMVPQLEGNLQEVLRFFSCGADNNGLCLLHTDIDLLQGCN